MNKASERNYFVKVYNSFMRNNNLSIRDKMVYIYLLGFGRCFATQYTMTRSLCISRPTLRSSLKSLENKGYIRVQRRHLMEGSESLTNIYTCVPVSINTGLPLKRDTEFS